MPAHRTARAKRTKKTAKARWQTRGPSHRPAVVIVGFGRLGGAIALGLRRAGWPVSVLPRSDESVRRAAQLNVPLADHEALKAAELCLLAVPDGAVPRAAGSIRDDLGPETALVHLAGALDLSAFGSEPGTIRRTRGSFHPLCAVSAPTDSLEGHAVAVAANRRELLPILWRMALALRLSPIEVPDARRAAYHAGAVMSAGLLVGLASAAVKSLGLAGLEEGPALAALLPLMTSALRGIEQLGLSRGQTGPLARGDLSVVQAHLAALPPELGNVYRVLSLQALQRLEERLPIETRTALERLLKSEGAIDQTRSHDE